ncbi:MAG: hypothetical protein KAR38_13010 [Calditrichia bacterium]|nr:hypothetical protein [Calditrichia bacterium]
MRSGWIVKNKSYKQLRGFIILLPADVALPEIMEEVLKKYNELENLLFDGYYVTNQEIPAETEIPEIV